jgi:hypothetical protein
MFALSRSDLVALARKYRLLVDARRARLGLSPHSGLTGLDAEFPGALSELARLSLEELEARQAELEVLAARGQVTPWVRWMIAYHAASRAAYTVRQTLGSVDPTDDIVHVLSRIVTREVGLACDEEFVWAALTAEPARVAVIVRHRVMSELGDPPAEAWAAVGWR